MSKDARGLLGRSASTQCKTRDETRMSSDSGRENRTLSGLTEENDTVPDDPVVFEF